MLCARQISPELSRGKLRYNSTYECLNFRSNAAVGLTGALWQVFTAAALPEDRSLSRARQGLCHVLFAQEKIHIC